MYDDYGNPIHYELITNMTQDFSEADRLIKHRFSRILNLNWIQHNLVPKQLLDDSSGCFLYGKRRFCLNWNSPPFPDVPINLMRFKNLNEQCYSTCKRLSTNVSADNRQSSWTLPLRYLDSSNKKKRQSSLNAACLVIFIWYWTLLIRNPVPLNLLSLDQLTFHLRSVLVSNPFLAIDGRASLVIAHFNRLMINFVGRLLAVLAQLIVQLIAIKNSSGTAWRFLDGQCGLDMSLSLQIDC